MSSRQARGSVFKAVYDDDDRDDADESSPDPSTNDESGDDSGSEQSTSDNADTTEDKLEKLDPNLVGMSVGFKKLYSGKEDRRGRFQWQDEIPKDVGKPAEDAETQKWALIVRQVKAYRDPLKTLRIHSIVVQSPLLKKMLEDVLKGYPGVTVGLHRLEFSDKLEPLIHRFSDLTSAIETLKESVSGVASSHVDQEERSAREGSAVAAEHDVSAETPREHEVEKLAGVVDGQEGPADQRLKLQHAELLRDVLVGEYQDLLDTYQDMRSKSVMTYDYLWVLFEPGAAVYSRQDGQERVFKLKSGKYGHDKNNNPVYWLILKYVDFDGSRFGYNTVHVSIPEYSGTRPIASLPALPLEFHREPKELQERIVARGEKVEKFAGTHYRAYDGVGWKLNAYGDKEKYSVKGRIIIDALGWNRYNPNYATYVTTLNRKRARSRLSQIEASEHDTDSDTASDNDEDDAEEDADHGGGMPMDGHFDADEDAPSQRPLTNYQKLICTPILRGYALKEKRWLNLFINSVHDISFNSRAFDSLVLPKNQKELVLGFASTQQSYRHSYDDVIEGKGRGIIILLCGPPGVGKTLTAESVAEEMKVPLFIMSAGDLGIDSNEIEASLLSVLSMCTRWNAVLLLDEAEIFLEARSLHELERNKIVSIFLRVLEYHEGIMFLTTNRVTTFDPAFHSRIHISLDYSELSVESRLAVWKNFLTQHNISQAASRARPPKESASAIKTDSNSGISEEVLSKRHHDRTQAHTITDAQIKRLSQMKMNGRQIKNVLKTSQLLASSKAEALKHEHITTVLEVTQHLHSENVESERTRDSLFF